MKFIESSKAKGGITKKRRIWRRTLTSKWHCMQQRAIGAAVLLYFVWMLVTSETQGAFSENRTRMNADEHRFIQLRLPAIIPVPESKRRGITDIIQLNSKQASWIQPEETTSETQVAFSENRTRINADEHKFLTAVTCAYVNSEKQVPRYHRYNST